MVTSISFTGAEGIKINDGFSPDSKLGLYVKSSSLAMADGKNRAKIIELINDKVSP
jgi:hypothetical protein